MTGGSITRELVNNKAIRLSLALVGAAACQAGMAQVATYELSPLPPRVEQTARLEISSSNLPRMDNIEGFTSGQRVDMTLLPPTSSAIGLAVGMRGYNQPAALTGAGLVPGTQPSIDLGVHWRHSLDSYRVDVTAWRRMTQQQPDAYTLAQQNQAEYGARVELNLSPAKSKTFADKGFLGVQLDNGGRISLRRKHGGPMVYYRNTF